MERYALIVICAMLLIVSVSGTLYDVGPGAGDDDHFGISMVLDSNGNPYIEYTDDNFYPVVAIGDSGSFSISSIFEDDMGWYGSIALDSNGYPCVAYNGIGHDALSYASWTPGGGWAVTQIENNDAGGQYTSIIFDSDGYPHISYFDQWNYYLKYAYYNGESWDKTTVDNEFGVGEFTSIALDSHGYPHISYYDVMNTDLKYAYWSGSMWVRYQFSTPADDGLYTSIAVDSDDNPHIAYYDDTNDDLKYSVKSGGTWSTSTVDSSGSVGKYCSLALDSDGYPHISYYDDKWGLNGALKYARYNGTAWVIESVTTSGNVGALTSLCIGSDDLTIHIAYYDVTNDRVKYAVFTNPPRPDASFTYTPHGGRYPITVSFTDTSSGSPTSWAWDIDNDGDTDYTTQDCDHTYTDPGTYTVKLTATSGEGSDIAYGTIYITNSFHARATPSETIAPVDTSAYSSFIEAIGGDDSPDNETEAAINWTQAGIAISAPFTDLMGSAFFFVLLSIPFVAMWIAQEKTWIPLLTGIIVLSFATLAGYIPAEYGIAVMAFIALSIAAIVWTLLRSR